QTLNPEPYTLHPTPYTLNPKPQTPNPKPQPPNPKHQTRHVLPRALQNARRPRERARKVDVDAESGRWVDAESGRPREHAHFQPAHPPGAPPPPPPTVVAVESNGV
ncbi:hypothetical protein T484DRAFT_1622611, partial [Baffinella frigidus]